MVSKIEGGHKRSVRCVGWKDYGAEDGAGVQRGGGGGNNNKRRKVTLATGSFDANVGVWEYNHGKTGRQAGWSATPAATATATAAEADEAMDDTPDTHPNGDADQDDDSQTTSEEWLFTTLLTGPDSEIKSLSFSPATYSANLLATSSRDKSVWIWEEVEPEEWETIAVLQEHSGDVKCVAWQEGVSLPPSQNLSAGGDAGRAEGEERRRKNVVGQRELLATGSYDDAIRLWRDVEEEGDWSCVAVLEGHAGTVWGVSWEKFIPLSLSRNSTTTNNGQEEQPWEVQNEPRLLSCSDDLSIRVWTRELSDTELQKKRNHTTNGTASMAGISQRLPSIIRPTGYFETWTESARLPGVHVRSVYAVDWSRRSGLVVSCGGDGVVAVFREVVSSLDHAAGKGDVDVAMTDDHDEAAAVRQNKSAGGKRQRETKWEVVALLEAAHEEYEVNHVCWAVRRDVASSSGDGEEEEEEVIISTGDEGDVKIWRLPEELRQGGVR